MAVPIPCTETVIYCCCWTYSFGTEYKRSWNLERHRTSRFSVIRHEGTKIMTAWKEKKERSIINYTKTNHINPVMVSCIPEAPVVKSIQWMPFKFLMLLSIILMSRLNHEHTKKSLLSDLVKTTTRSSSSVYHPTPNDNNTQLVDKCPQILASLDYANQIDQDLRIFERGGAINETHVHDSLELLHRAVLVRIRNNMVFVEFKNNTEHDKYLKPNELKRWRGQLSILLKASCFVKLPDVDFVLFLPDKVQEIFPSHLPFFHFQKKRNGKGILMPFTSHLEDLRPYQRKILENSNYEWDEKDERLIWRGSTTGGHFNVTNWNTFPRSKLVLACTEQPELNEICDAAFIGFTQVSSKEDKSFLQQKFPLGKSISMEDHMKYKYIAWLDGNGPCSGRSEKLVFGNSLLFKVKSPYIEFYYNGLKPNQHYIEVEGDMSDLVEKLNWAKLHDNEAQQIVNNMKSFSQQLSPESISCYMQRLLERYAALISYNVKPLSELANARPVLPGTDYGISPGICQNPIYACKEYLLKRKTKAFDSKKALLGDKGLVPEKCFDFFPMFKDQLQEYYRKEVEYES